VVFGFDFNGLWAAQEQAAQVNAYQFCYHWQFRMQARKLVVCILWGFD